MIEIWKKLEMAPMYEVSNLGNVKSSYTNRQIKKFDNGCGYLFVVMKHNNKRLTKYVHRLVAQEFCEKIDESKSCVNHIDGDKYNNTSSNLEFCTYKENTKHAISIGRETKGNTKIPVDDVKYIFSLQDKKMDAYFANKYGVGLSAIRDIRGGRTHAKHTKPLIQSCKS